MSHHSVSKISNRSQYLLLEQCEAIIEEGLQTLEKVERALAIIEQMKLYKNGFETFECYSDKRWKRDMKLPHLCQIQLQN
jgi:hypothetical protein